MKQLILDRIDIKWLDRVPESTTLRTREYLNGLRSSRNIRDTSGIIPIHPPTSSLTSEEIERFLSLTKGNKSWDKTSDLSNDNK